MLYYITDFCIKLLQLISVFVLFYISICFITVISLKINLQNYVGVDSENMIIGMLSILLTYLMVKGINLFFSMMKEQKN